MVDYAKCWEIIIHIVYLSLISSNVAVHVKGEAVLWKLNITTVTLKLS